MVASPRPVRRVAILHNGDKYGGMEKYTLLLARYLDPNRYRVHVIIPGYFYQLASTERFRSEVQALGIPLHQTPEHLGRNLLQYAQDCWKVAEMLHNLQINIVHIQTSEAFSGRLVTLGATIAGVPVLRSEHIPPSAYAGPGDWRRAWPLDRLTHGILVDSAANMQDQIDTLRRSQKKLHWLHTGIDFTHLDLSYDKARAKALLGLDVDRPVIGTVGRLEEQKGQRYLVQAARQVLDVCPEAQFVIVGDGPLREELQEMAGALGIADQIHFAGFLGDYVTYMEAMDIGVMPSLWEGFSLSLLEFMALSKPLVVSDHPSFTEALTDGETALITPMRDAEALATALLKLLHDPALATRLGQAAGQGVSERYSIERLVGEMMALYDEMVVD
ncbi:MAG: glycosyltransferase family 4 protein [Anaerolineales bacterium]|nr:glycosyltransferase family 4 protein [Anaerolineales bacterium]